MMSRTLLALLTAALLSACGLSPQVVNLAPSPAVENSNVGENRAISVLARDARDKDEFGSRGGIYPETSLIRPGNDVPKAIYDAVTAGLQAQGFNAYNPTSEATNLEVRLTELSYTPGEGNLVNRVQVSASVEAVASRPQVEHTGRYQSSVTHDMPLTPSAARNEEMINDVLERTLARLLSDPKMLSFLAGNDES